MEFYRIPSEESKEQAVPTIGTLNQGQCFLRDKVPHQEKFVYMVVGICGDIRYELKDVHRSMLIINLVTGRVFSGDSYEEIIPLPHAGIIEDVVVQQFKYRKPKKTVR